MSLLARLAAAFRPESRAGYYPPPGPSFALASGTGPVSPMVAENLSAVVACTNAIAGTVATLPACVYQSNGDGRIEAPGHPVARLVRAPNDRQSWPDFIEWLLAQCLLYGNGLAAIESDGRGAPVALIPIPWRSVQPRLLPNGRLAFDVVAYQQPWGGTGLPRRLLADEVLHLRDRSDDGFLGRSRISRAPAALDSALGLQTFASAIWANAATPSGVLTLPPNINPDGMRRLKESFEANFSGVGNARRVIFVDKDSTFTPMSVSPEDAQVLASRQFSVIEICRLFNVPPPIIQDYSHSTFTNASQASTWFATNTLTPWARKIEAEFSRSVFTDPAFHLEIDLSGLVRGDYATRWTANVAAVTAGILTVDEVRAAEGYGPRADAAPAEDDPAEDAADPADAEGSPAG